MCIVSETLWIPCCPFRKGDWDSPGLPTAVSSMLHPLLKNSGLVQLLADWITPLCPSGLVFWPGFLLLQLTWIFSSTWAFFFFDPKKYWGSDGHYLGGERHAEFSNCSGSMFVLQAWKELSTLDTEPVFSQGFSFPCLISFPFLSTILKNGMDGGEKNFHVKMWAMCLVQESGKLLISNRLMPNGKLQLVAEQNKLTLNPWRSNQQILKEAMCL